MKRKKTLFGPLYVLLLVSSLSIQPEAKLKSEISTIDKLLEIFDRKTQPTIIMAYADHCPFCTMVAPKFENLSLNKKYKNIEFTSANGKNLDIHQHVKHKSNGKHNIPGYPSFIFIHNGQIVDLLIGGKESELQEKIESFAKKTKR